MFKGLQIIIVEPNYIVGKDEKGIDQVVTDNNAIIKGSKMWVTASLYSAIKDKL